MGKAATDRLTGLTAKQDAFCFEAAKLGDGNKAYRQAYDASGMKPESVRAEVSKLMRNPLIVDRIEGYRAQFEAKLDVTIERIARELACVGFSKISDLYDDEGRPIPLHLLPDAVGRAVQSVTLVERRSLLPLVVLRDKAGNAVDEYVPGDEKGKKRVAKALERQGAKASAEGSLGVEWVPMREKKVTFHEKLPALRTMAQWKRMIDQDRQGDQAEDPNDVRQLTDDELEARIAADEAFLKGLRAARGKSKAGQAAEAAKAKG